MFEYDIKKEQLKAECQVYVYKSNSIFSQLFDRKMKSY